MFIDIWQIIPFFDDLVDVLGTTLTPLLCCSAGTVALFENGHNNTITHTHRNTQVDICP